ncbi:hypothetical protein MGAD_24390 [Mycolicibacterium gadium]|uniref:Uncharacterized protein n=1 Tax=Mycolicibacterium gadium TaxID=1794 RepID=A0A7I7WKH7_MYCGU|nr:hypothetical protein MGAD_24390 [Mycolicibacterium gadium]
MFSPGGAQAVASRIGPGAVPIGLLAPNVAPAHVFDPFPAALDPFLDLAGATPLVNTWVGNGGTGGCW